MDRILIIGANGAVGQKLCIQLSSNKNYEPLAMIRDEKQKSFFEEKNIKTIQGDLEASVDDLSKLMKDADGIVFTAGSGGKTGDDKTLTIDLDGAVKCMEAAEQENIKRFIIVSATNADKRSFWDMAGDLKPYYMAKHYADRILKASALDYTIIRPGRLLDEEGRCTASNQLDKDSQRGIAREDVASAIVSALQHRESIKKIIELHYGDQPINELVQSA